MTEQGPGIGDQGSGTDRAEVRLESNTPHAVLDELLASLVRPPTPVDLRASVLRRIEAEQDKRSALIPWPWSRGWATLAAATAVVVLAAAMVLWRGSHLQPSTDVTRSAGRTLRPGSGQTTSAPTERIRPSGAAAESDVARVERPTRTANRSSRPSAADTAAADVTEALPALEAPAPLQVSVMTTDLLTTDALEVERLQVPPIEIAPLDIDRARNPQR